MEIVPSLSLLIATSIIFLILWVKKRLTYWQQRGVKIPSLSFHWKYLSSGFLLKNAFADRDMLIYKSMKEMNLTHGGGFYFYLTPFYVPMDIEIIKSILQNDFQHFVDRGMYVSETEPLTGHLFSLPGRKWKLLRHKLTPTFTSGKMKMMFEHLVKCSQGLYGVLDQKIGEPVDIKEILGRFTTDVIVSCAFGLNCNTLENQNGEFRDNARSLFSEKDFLGNIKFGLFFAIPTIMRFFKVNYIPPEVSNFFCGVVKDTVSYREKNEIYRKDFLHLLIQLKNRGQLVEDEKLKQESIEPKENTVTMDEIMAQAFLFFEAGLETSSTAMTYCLYELGKNPSIQDRLRDEINRVLDKYDGKVTYEAMNEMVYLEQVLCETLRKYPPLSSLPRICTKDYKIPGTDLVIEKGVRVCVPVFGIHRDPEYYPNPEKFDPERFNEENQKNRPEFTYMPFGRGPRICIAWRFGVMQAKVGLLTLLKAYQFKVSGKTKEPLEFNPKIVNMSIKGELWLECKRLSKFPVPC